MNVRLRNDDAKATVTVAVEYDDVVVTRIYKDTDKVGFGSRDAVGKINVSLEFVSSATDRLYTESRVYKDKVCANCGKMLERIDNPRNRMIFDPRREWWHKATQERECNLFAQPVDVEAAPESGNALFDINNTRLAVLYIVGELGVGREQARLMFDGYSDEDKQWTIDRAKGIKK